MLQKRPLFWVPVFDEPRDLTAAAITPMGAPPLSLTACLGRSRAVGGRAASGQARMPLRAGPARRRPAVRANLSCRARRHSRGGGDSSAVLAVHRAPRRSHLDETASCALCRPPACFCPPGRRWPAAAAPSGVSASSLTVGRHCYPAFRAGRLFPFLAAAPGRRVPDPSLLPFLSPSSYPLGASSPTGLPPPLLG